MAASRFPTLSDYFSSVTAFYFWPDFCYLAATASRSAGYLYFRRWCLQLVHIFRYAPAFQDGSRNIHHFSLSLFWHSMYLNTSRWYSLALFKGILASCYGGRKKVHAGLHTGVWVFQVISIILGLQVYRTSPAPLFRGVNSSCFTERFCLESSRE